MQAPGHDRDRPWVYHPHTLPGLALLLHQKSTQELQLPGRERVTRRSWWGNSPAAVQLHLGGSFCSLLALGLGLGFFTSVRNLKNLIPRFVPVENLHLYDLEKKKCIFFISEIQREHRAVDTKPAQSKTGQGTNLRVYQSYFGKCNSYYNDTESYF